MCDVASGREPCRVRAGSPADCAALADIDTLVSASPRGAARFEAACGTGDNRSECALVLEQAGVVRGFIVLAPVLDEVSIHAFAVHPEHRRQGHARRLLDGALERMRHAGARRCLLEVRISNLAARGLYEQFGFACDGVRKAYYPAGDGREDALLLSLQL
ncbi:MAG: ribosomal protein S18-alanine N-acetyltransferase [Halioglobus sp.]|nr:ribosomal protein S18-alanine N-acetyltransferase [Halioglobus sp.]